MQRVCSVVNALIGVELLSVLQATATVDVPSPNYESCLTHDQPGCTVQACTSHKACKADAAHCEA